MITLAIALHLVAAPITLDVPKLHPKVFSASGMEFVGFPTPEAEWLLHLVEARAPELVQLANDQEALIGAQTDLIRTSSITIATLRETLDEEEDIIQAQRDIIDRLTGWDTSPLLWGAAGLAVGVAAAIAVDRLGD